MPEKKTTTVKDQVALLEGIERHWKGYLLQLAGKVLLTIAGGIAGGGAIAAARHLFL